jgi:hypothetical protein
MRKITAASFLGIILITITLLGLAPGKPAEKTFLDQNVINIAALPASTSVPTPSPNINSTNTQQEPTPPQSTNYDAVLPLPSPFIVAVFIVGLVAAFGSILSLCLRKRRNKH